VSGCLEDVGTKDIAGLLSGSNGMDFVGASGRVSVRYYIGFERMMPGHRRTDVRKAQGSNGHGCVGNGISVQRTASRLKTLRLSEVTWKPGEAKAGNGHGGTWKKGAPSNNVRGWPLGGTGRLWQHSGLVVTMVRRRWRGKLRRVDAPEGMIIDSFLRTSAGAGSRLRMTDWNSGG